MTWLNLPALVGLVAVGVPVLIHLLGRRQARRQKFPTLRFLDGSRLLPTRRTRLTDLLLLAVRAGIVTAAALALAQPVLSTTTRSASLQNTVARAIVVDTSASMLRPAQSGAAGLRVLDVARTSAQRLASEATTSLIIETATPARAIPGAVDWLRAQPGHAGMVMISDFQTGTVDSTELATVPADIGIALTPVVAATDTAALTVTVRGGTTVTTARVSLTPEHTAVEWRTAPVARDTAVRFPILLTGDRERLALGAAEHAALASGAAWGSVANEPIAIVYPGSAERADLIRAAKPITERWMADVLVRLRSDSVLIAAASAATPVAFDLPFAGRDSVAATSPMVVVARDTARRPVAVATVGTIQGRATLLLVSTVDAGSLASAALIRAAAQAAVAPTPVTELEPSTIPADQLHRWERPSAPAARPGATPANGESDGRWLWMIALALLALETWMRRTRPTSAYGQQLDARPRERAA